MVEPTSRRSHSDDDQVELLELGPAEALEQDPPAVRMGKGIDGDPVARLPGSPSKKLPGPLRIGRQEPVEEPEGEPARLEPGLIEQAVGELEVAGRPFSPGGLPKAAVDGGAERPADPVGGPEAWGDAMLAVEILGVGEGRKAPSQGSGKGIRICRQVGQAAPELDRRGLVLGDEGHGPRADLGRRHHPVRPSVQPQSVQPPAVTC